MVGSRSYILSVAPGMHMLAEAGDRVGAVGEGRVLHVIVCGVMTYGECGEGTYTPPHYEEEREW